jgi:hypothetical protein
VGVAITLAAVYLLRLGTFSLTMGACSCAYALSNDSTSVGVGVEHHQLDLGHLSSFVLATPGGLLLLLFNSESL